MLAQRAGQADRGGAADGERADRVDGLGDGGEPDQAALVRQGALVDGRDGVVRQSLTVREGLAAGEPGNTTYARDLSVSYERLADLDLRAGRVSEAREQFRRAVGIRRRLCRREPRRIDLAGELAVALRLLADTADQAVDQGRRLRTPLGRGCTSTGPSPATGPRPDPAGLTVPSGRVACRTLEPSPRKESTVTAQPEHPAPAPRVRPIPHTIDAVAGALGPAKRMAFYAEIGQAEEGEPINTVLRKWWMEAMFDSRPGREQRLADADAGRNLVPLPGLAGEQRATAAGGLSS